VASEEKSNILLTADQRQAVEHVYGPMVVVAGAGCGKTRVLTERIAYLLRTGVCQPDEILAVTFTVNAAKGIRDRVARQLPDIDVSALKADTFHGYCNHFLKRAKKSFQVVEDTDLKVYLRKHIESLPLKIFTRAASPGQFIDQLIKFNARCQDELVTAQDYGKYVEELKRLPLIPPPRVMRSKEMDSHSRDEFIARCEEISAVYSHVTKLLNTNKWGTFGDMLQDAIKLLRKDAAKLTDERRGCRFILIDEFQDSNYAQIELASLLGGEDANIFVVGDPDQAIYKFRGATAGAFEEFRQRYPHAKQVTLAENFRSTPAVLACAHQHIEANPPSSLGRLPLNACGDLRDVTEPVRVFISAVSTEASAIADAIEQKQAEIGAAWADFAVLYKNHDHREALLEEFHARKIPVEVAGADLTDTTELRDLLSAARAVIRPDDSVALMRTAALGCFAVDPAELKRAMAAAERNTPVVHTLKSVRGGAEVLGMLRRVKDEIAKLDAAAALTLIQRRFDLPPSHPADELQEFTKKWLKKPICEESTLGGFLEYLDLYHEAGARVESEAKSTQDAVQLMTVHAAKGLEFRHVFVIKTNTFGGNYKEDLFEFPAALSRTRSDEPPAESSFQYEQRRVFYVAMTRAKESLTLSARATGKGEPVAGYCKEFLGRKALESKIALTWVKDATTRIEASTAPALPIEEWVALPASRWSERVQLSASAIESYNICPLKFKLERDWNIPGETTANLHYGAAVHLALKAYYDGVIAGRTPTLDDLLQSFADSMDTATIADPHQARLYRAQGRVHLTAFYNARSGREPNVLATEQWFDVTVRGVNIRGRMDRIDRVEGGVHIWDYKTGRPKDDDVAKKSLQLGIYALAAREKGMQAVALSFHNLEDNSVGTTIPTAADLIKVETEIERVANSIRRGEFDAKKGYHCRNCEYRTICPAHEEKLYTIAKAVATVQ
jgi:DNA helicase II / ATP-dependent DNA helicase PcrA